MSLAHITDDMRKAIKICKDDPIFFIENFCKITHPSAGIVPFKLFSYQKKAIRTFRDPDSKYCIFHKVRQSGISTLCGGYALWYAMFHNDKAILIVSKKDDDAKDFLRKNVKFLYDFLPSWMRALWSLDPSEGGKENTKEVVFPNGSRITSLTSSPTVMRSHAASLYIIDESAFIQDMDRMWEGAAPTLTHGGRCIIISTPNGMGNWYYRTVRDAEAGSNDFKLIQIDWQDMDWEITYEDEFGNEQIIAPRKGIRRTATPEEEEKYGEWISPWLEEQYRKLASDGDDKKFRQEVLHEFLGTGDTILPRLTLQRMNEDIEAPAIKLNRVQHRNPITEEVYSLVFSDHLWIWEEPNPNHLYAMGVDASPGDGDGDPSAIVVWNLNTLEQAAELNLRCETKTLAKMADFIGRGFNNAIAVVERDAWGTTVLQELRTVLCYPNIYRHIKEGANLRRKPEKYGWPTSGTSKAEMNANLVQSLSDQGGFRTKSERLVREAEIYVQLNASKVGAEPGHGNHDDIIVASALGLLGSKQAFLNRTDGSLLPMETRGQMPIANEFRTGQEIARQEVPIVVNPLQPKMDPRHEALAGLMGAGGRDALVPMPMRVDTSVGGDYATRHIQEVMKFAQQLGSVPLSAPGQGGVVNPRRYPDLKRK